ncbi:MAG: transposase [Phaeodactylibacter sp.]|nr:transposase [Phaeodactylibacter sp.]
MQSTNLKPAYKRNLPHIQPLGATFFVTFRLKGSVPWVKIQELRIAYRARVAEFKAKYGKYANEYIQEERQRFFLVYDKLLDQVLTGPTYLKQPEIAAEVEKQLHRFDGELYSLLAYCIMPNHVHMLIDTGEESEDMFLEEELEKLEHHQLHRIMNRIKGASARYCNLLLGHTGKFWQRESFDRFIRDEKHLHNVISYILENPVKAGLVRHWEEWPFSYWKVYEE